MQYKHKIKVFVIVGKPDLVGYVSDKSNSRLEKYSISWLDENFETVGVTISLNKYVKNKLN